MPIEYIAASGESPCSMTAPSGWGNLYYPQTVIGEFAHIMLRADDLLLAHMS